MIIPKWEVIINALTGEMSGDIPSILAIERDTLCHTSTISRVKKQKHTMAWKQF